MSALLYPDVFHKFDNFRKLHADVGVLPTPAFFYGLRPDEEITVEIEPGKSLIIRFLTVGEPHPDGTRTLFFELNGQPREIQVRDRALKIAARSHPKADPADPGQVAAPTSGVVTGIAVQAGHSVKRGEKLMTLEAMKLQSNIYAPVTGPDHEDSCHAQSDRGSQGFAADDYAQRVKNCGSPQSVPAAKAGTYETRSV